MNIFEKILPIDTQRNLIIKEMDVLLRTIDPRVTWIDYIPGHFMNVEFDLAVIGVGNTAKYVDVTKKSSFKVVNEILNAMDDYRVDTQFLNNRQVAAIATNISDLSKNRVLLISNTNKILDNLTENDCSYILHNAQKEGYLTRFYLEDIECRTEYSSKQLLLKEINSNKLTLIDTIALTKMIEAAYLKEVDYTEEEYSDYDK